MTRYENGLILFNLFAAVFNAGYYLASPNWTNGVCMVVSLVCAIYFYRRWSR